VTIIPTHRNLRTGLKLGMRKMKEECSSGQA
jgi:hypothetical protein